MLYCVRLKMEHRGRCLDVGCRLGSDVEVGNPITFWVRSDMTLDQIEAQPEVLCAVESTLGGATIQEKTDDTNR